MKFCQLGEPTFRFNDSFAPDIFITSLPVLKNNDSPEIVVPQGYLQLKEASLGKDTKGDLCYLVASLTENGNC